MKDELHDAKEELKRVDHLIYVSLKYTRTVDVLRNVVCRLINSFDFIADSLLKKAEDDGKLEVVPTAPKLKCERLQEIYHGDKDIQSFVKLYLLLRRVINLDFTRENEYRRHVAMVLMVDGEQIKVDIDTVTEYYQKAKELIEYIENTYAQ